MHIPLCMGWVAHSIGKTKSPGKREDTDLALEVLLADFIGILEHLFPDVQAAPSLLVSQARPQSAPSPRAAPYIRLTD